MEKLNVICFLWGSWPEPGWGHEYVRRLYRGVQRNLKTPHRFICYTDVVSDIDEGIEVRFNPYSSWPGCLPKLFAYSPDAALEGRVLILDLDNVITGDLRPMAAYRGPLAVRAWFAGYARGNRVADGDMIGFKAGSGVAKKIWKTAIDDVPGMIENTGGRERMFLRQFRPELWQDILGETAILSYKNHIRGGQKLSKDTCIVSCHDGGGKKPATARPHQLEEDFILQHWV